MTTYLEIAEWMMLQLERSDRGELKQQETAYAIQKDFGAEFVYLDLYGNLAIDRKILYRFKKLSPATVVWVAVQGDWLAGYWRLRVKNDKPCRLQNYW